MRQWKGDTGGGTLGQRLLLVCFRLVDLRLGYAVMAIVVPFYMLFARQGYLSVYHYFRHRHGHSAWDAFRRTYRNHYLFGQVILDRFAIYAGKSDAFEVEIVGNEHYERLAGGDKGFIIAGSHVGNFEIGGYLLHSYQKKINALIYAGETETVKRNRAAVMSGNNINLIPVREDMSHLFSVNSALQNGEIVSMPCDRKLGSTKSVECNFLGARATFPIGAFALAVSFGVEVLAVFCMKISSRKYRVTVSPLEEVNPLRTKAKKDLVNNLAQSYVRRLEETVRQYPEQWFNFYEFWKQA
ncbi:MAG: lipid A biosynthesis (KDO)2-(lauroyl)-lipid IVA acyltransferase [Dysgonamonadaceae bacterium]|jgi:predicted LPLAT superfamily acyltransferase|nr:lipid A biosynthesis (KDO)2-(lauroyl)-lipid IVA acyltransferase [Dysgonamonadaceae bacterium]